MRAALVGDYEFEEAATVEEAIETARTFRPDVALIDVMMPGGSGLEIIKQVSRDPRLRRARCVVVSAFAGEDDRREAQDAGAHAFIAKPFDPDELAAIVAGLLEQR
jgi:two-component system phosphate regulon response regulator PhoB